MLSLIETRAFGNEALSHLFSENNTVAYIRWGFVITNCINVRVYYVISEYQRSKYLGNI